MMLPGWDKSQDLRGTGEMVNQPSTDITKAVADAADRITAARVVTQMVREGKRMSLLGKLQHLTEDADKFTQETSDVLDGISDKIKTAREKSAEAKQKHHDYYDGIIAGVNESIKVIDRLSNGPLPGDGKA